jgi:hypothetical protein
MGALAGHPLHLGVYYQRFLPWKLSPAPSSSTSSFTGHPTFPSPKEER